MTAVPSSRKPLVARLLARTTAIAAGIAVVTSAFLIVATGSVEAALFTVFAAASGSYAAKVGWRSS